MYLPYMKYGIYLWNPLPPLCSSWEDLMDLCISPLPTIIPRTPSRSGGSLMAVVHPPRPPPLSVPAALPAATSTLRIPVRSMRAPSSARVAGVAAGHPR